MAENAILKNLKKGKTKEIEYDGDKYEVRQLTLGQVNEFTELANQAENPDDFETNKRSLCLLLKYGVVGLESMDEEELIDIPITTIKDVSAKVLEYNGLQTSEEVNLGND